MKNTKKALLLSVMSLVLCVSMLVGTTFAWFTDSVSTANNTIASGNLDVVLSYKLDENDAWVEVNENTKLFDDAALWEPGYTQVVYLKVANVGSLALKYQLGLNILSELSGTNVDEETFKLSDYIQFGVIETEDENFYADRAAARAAVTSSKKISAGYSKASKLYATNNVPTDGLTEEYVALVVYMPETVGNEANHLTGTAAPSITLGLNLVATQLMAEEDSFDETYDKDAWVEGWEVRTEQDLLAALNNGKTNIILMDNIALSDAVAIPAGTTLNLDMNGKTISNDAGYVFENQGNLTIAGNGTATGMGIIRSKAGSVTIENGNFFASSRWQDGVYQHTLKAENTNVVINGGNFDATVNGQSNAVLNASAGSTITINGGSFKNVSGDLSKFDPYLFTYEKDGKVIINDGTFYGGWRFNGETATTDIHGGTFTVGFDGQSFHAASTHVVTVDGGLFVSQPSAALTTKLPELVATGFKAIENNGKYVVVPESVDYVIASAADLLAMSGGKISGTYALVADIDLAGAGLGTIGADYGKELNVIGNGFTISNAELTHTSHNGMKHYGMFYAYTNSKLTVSDLTIRNVNMDNTEDTERNYGVGVVVCYADGGSNVLLDNVDVYDCTLVNNKADIGDECGTYVGYQTGTLTMVDCDSTGCSVAGETAQKTGAFIGMVNGTATLTNCTTDLTIGSCNRVSGTLTEN